MAGVFSRRLGWTEREVPALALGSWHTWDRVEFVEVVEVIRAAVSAGATYFDVGPGIPPAPGVPGAPSDIIFARAAQAAGIQRDDYVLQISAWLDGGSDTGLLREQVERQLYRIGADGADIVMIGPRAHDAESIASVADGVHEVMQSGMVSNWGVINWSASEIRSLIGHLDSRGTVRPALAQLRYGVVRRSVAEGDPYARLMDDYGIGLQSAVSLESGYLLGKGRRQDEDHVTEIDDPGDVHDRIDQVRPRLADLAREHDCSMTALCMSYVLTNERLCSALVGARTLTQLREQLEAFTVLRRLGRDDVRAVLAPFWLDRGRVDPHSRG